LALCQLAPQRSRTTPTQYTLPSRLRGRREEVQGHPRGGYRPKRLPRRGLHPTRSRSPEMAPPRHGGPHQSQLQPRTAHRSSPSPWIVQETRRQIRGMGYREKLRHATPRRLVGSPCSTSRRVRMADQRGDVNPWLQILSALDVTEIFKTKGNLRRWSAKRSVGGVIVLEALWQIHEFGLSWQGVALCCVGILPLCLSFFETQ